MKTLLQTRTAGGGGVLGETAPNIDYFHKMSLWLRRFFRLFYVFIKNNRFFGLFVNYLCYVCGKTKLFYQPVFIQVEPTNICNLSCSLCATGKGILTRSRGDMDFHAFRKLIDTNQRNLAYLVLYNMGEPFLNSSILEMIDYAASKNVFTKVSTNGFFKTKDLIKGIVASKLDELHISLDFSTRESYRRFKGKDVFPEVIDNISLLVKARANKFTPFITAQLLLTRENEDKINDFISLARTLGVDRVVMKKLRANIYNDTEYPWMLPLDERYLRAYYLDEKKSAKYSCFYPWVSVTVYWDGTVVPCCFDVDGEYVLGNVKNSLLSVLWKGEKYAGFRHSLLNNPAKNHLCRECSMKNLGRNFIRNG